MPLVTPLGFIGVAFDSMTYIRHWQLPSVPLGPEVCHGLAQPKGTYLEADIINKICSLGGECQESSRLKTTGYIYIEIC